MSRCPGCSYPIHATQILCNKCYNQDLTTRWPKCQTCFFHDACGEAGYELCIYCHMRHLEARHEAAIKIQRVFREVVEKYYAATMIQALWRGHSSRRGFVCDRSPLRCEVCRIDDATMVNEYGNYEDVCADCFWDIRDAWRHESHLREMAKLIH